MNPTKTITTPVGQAAIELKSWITGRDREYIDSGKFAGIDMTPKIQGDASTVDIKKLDVAKMQTEKIHREIATFVVSINGSKENILDSVLDMHEDDYAFILKEIRSKKNEPAQPTE